MSIDGFVKNPLGPLIVIPAKAGIQPFPAVMDSCLRRNDAIFDFLRFRQWWKIGTALYLASDASRHVSGHTIVIDGGWIA